VCDGKRGGEELTGATCVRRGKSPPCVGWVGTDGAFGCCQCDSGGSHHRYQFDSAEAIHRYWFGSAEAIHRYLFGSAEAIHCYR
jgi:hypothetical protein